MNSFPPLPAVPKAVENLSFKDINSVDITDTILNDLVMKGLLKNEAVIYDFLFEIVVDVRP
jgi:hypothetical protein